MKKGLFILVDGPSASGKDSIINQLLKDLEKLNLKADSIEETKEKNYDREKILLAKEKGDKEAASVIINQRKKLYQEIVMPTLLKKIVIANRGETTTLAYQTLNNELTMQNVWDMHRNQNIPLPSLVVITNCSVKEAIRREKLRKPSLEEKDGKFMSGKFTIDSKKMGFENRTRVHEAYEKVKNFLEEKGVPVTYLNTDNMNIPQEAESILNFITSRKIILVDMDGVLADFEKGFLDSWQRKFPTHPHIPLKDRKTFSVFDDYPNNLRDDVGKIAREAGFFQNLPEIEGAKEGLEEIQRLGHEVFICTKPIDRYENCVLEKYNWVAKHLGYEWTKKIIVTKDKTLIHGDILIDDRPKHKGLRKPVWKHILFDKPYNKNAKENIRITWKSWKEALSL